VAAKLNREPDMESTQGRSVSTTSILVGGSPSLVEVND
jgi:hypothetical protein